MPSNYHAKSSSSSGSSKLVTVTIPQESVNDAKTTGDENKPFEGGLLEHTNNDIEDNWTSFDEGLMKDIVKELDDWDNDDSANTEQLLRTNQLPTTHEEHGNSSHNANRPSMCSDAVNAQPVPSKSQSVQKNAQLTVGTPLRPDLVSHVSPVTLLSCSAAAQLPSPIICNPPPNLQNTCSSANSDICIVSETPPNFVENAVNFQTKLSLPGNISLTMPPTAHQQVQTVSSFNHNIIRTSTPAPLSSTPYLSKCTLSVPVLCHDCNTPNSALMFRTPSTSEWMKVKRLSSGSTHSPSPSSTHTPSPRLSGSISGELLSIGGKVTPPLCSCGKRTKRRNVSNPGPNEGRTFYACPNGKASDKSRGCGFFTWEKMLTSSCSPQRLAKSQSQASTALSNMLEPEYFESKR